MATVPTLRTWTDGEVITATMMNENFRDVTEWMVNDKPHAFLRQLSTTTSVPKVTWTDISWDFEDVDTDAGITEPSATYTVKTAGYYLVTGHINWNNDFTDGIRAAKIVKNGANIPGAYQASDATAVATGNLVTCVVLCAVNDTIKLQGWQDHTAAGNISTNLNYTNFRNETSFLDIAWWGK